MMNVFGLPGQPFADGVTVIVAVTATLLLLIAVKAGIFPLPLAASPMEVLLFVHVKLVFATGLVKLMILVIAPSHTAWLAG